MAVVLKIKNEGDVHRVVLPDGEVTYDKILDALRQIYPNGTLSAKYHDDEGDLCVLCQGSFADFLALSDGKTLKLEVRVSTETTAAPPTDKPPADEQPPASGEYMETDVAGQHRHSWRGWKGCKGFGKGGTMWEVRKNMFILMQLHKNGLLNCKSFAAMATHLLPEIAAFVAQNGDAVDVKVKTMNDELRSLIKDFCSQGANMPGVPGLDKFKQTYDSFIREVVPISYALSELLLALKEIPFDDRVHFLQTFFAQHEQRFQEVVGANDEYHWQPHIPLDHVGVACDGCDKMPLQGLRFKCTSRPDFDLCSECFVDKSSTFCGSSDGEHTYEMICFPSPCLLWKAMAKGKGKCGKGKWGDWGKCSGKRNAQDVLGDSVDTQRRVSARSETPCASPGCQYMATWDKTHCCNACRSHPGKDKHGPKCDRKSCAATAPEPAVSEVAAQQYDFTFPVEVEDGRRLTISWNRGDCAQDVASAFAHQHGIPPEELTTIVAFVHTANASVAVNSSGSSNACSPPQTDSKTDSSEFESYIVAQAKKLEDMGLGSMDVLVELLRNNEGSAGKVVEMLMEGR
eukprot:TRINITY_DN9833_c0_g2_i1.p1 TRINITY_DN9833_c0_g2~~TRINITY_DN9833_c0_g2_i1.p1  ORF type:complete len:571 (-),score=95.41 TRINITY_DN9833_c0_g2_i1:55-1767(-)